MKKYERLVQSLATQIRELHALRDEYDALVARLNRTNPSHDDFEALDTAFRLSDEADAAHTLWAVKAEAIQEEVEVAYAEVPFAAPRRQGIEKFWELADALR